MKKAFTMLELVFVIVVIGILSAVFIPKFGQNKLSEAGTQLISHIRYAQHLAMIDDMYNASNGNWSQDRWQIKFAGNKYSLVSNFAETNATYAVNPLDKTTLLQNLDLNAKYGVTVSFAGSCNTNAAIAFDHLGRPFLGTTYMNTPCQIVLSRSGSTLDINITQETGYVNIQ